MSNFHAADSNPCISDPRVVNNLTGVSVAVSGAAGQGIETVAGLLASVLKHSGYNVFVTREFMSRIRGGTNSVQLRVSSERVAAYSQSTDIAVPLEKGALTHLAKYSRIGRKTLILGEKNIVMEEPDLRSDRRVALPLTDKAKEAGGAILLNTVAAGVVAAFFDVQEDVVEERFRVFFGSKGEDIVQKNMTAYRAGHAMGTDAASRTRTSFKVTTSARVKSEMLLAGTNAVALGAIAGGCNFISSYPMSPSTDTFAFLSQHAREFGIVVDQAEDEIAAMNKGLGAWYAGARAMVSTSGGGFALMTEGLSLSGMIESPMVIHLGQRPGPATGMPTRTGQEDLLNVVHTGHGEFPRVVFTPGTLEDGFRLTQKAFNVADKFQVPVFVLTDQFFVDSSYNVPGFDLSKEKTQKQFVRTPARYERYVLTENGVSPRGIPGHGEGLVVVDSDEHDEEGHITEDLHLRTKMVDKRMKRKLAAIRKEAEPPRLVGPKNYRLLVMTWGSNYHVVKEAIEMIDDKRTAMLHFRQVYPLHRSTDKYLDAAKEIAVVENNAKCQFGRLIQLETGHTVDERLRLLKYNGLPFAVEEVVAFLKRVTRRR